MSINTKPIEWRWKRFSDLSTSELYVILKARQEVFVVEQTCVYLDIDNVDQDAWHLMGWVNGDLAAYLRVVDPNKKYPEASLGRVLTRETHRGGGYGKALLKEAIAFSRANSQSPGLRISAQNYLKKYYESYGFQQCSEIYDEDGIPHIEMELIF